MTPPFLGTLLRRGGGGGLIKDNFNRSIASGLGVTSTGGLAWNVLTGAWSDNGTRATTSTSQASNPLAVVSPGTPNGESLLTLGTGDALYFRVKNSTNWWRILYEGYQTSSCQSCCSTCCSTCYNTCTSSYYDCYYSCSRGCGGCGCSCNYNQNDRCQLDGGSCTYSCGSYSCNCYSCNCYSCNCTYYNNYRPLLQKMISGVLTTVSTGPVASSADTTRAKVVLKGPSLSAYYGVNATTLLYSGLQSDLSTETKHGIGRGSSSYNISSIDDFEFSWS